MLVRRRPVTGSPLRRSSGSHQSSASRDIDVLIFVAARTRLDRYEELLWQLGGWRDVKIVLDRREGERREPHNLLAGVERRRAERRQRHPDLRKLGWCVVETDESLS